MAGLDYREQLDSAIWTLLEANAVVDAGVKEGCRIKLYSDGKARQRVHRAPADYPQLRVDVRGRANVGQRAQLTFGANLTTATVATLGDPIVPATQDVLITLVYDKERMGDQTPLEAGVRQALFTKFSKLNLSWVTSFTLGEPQRRDVAEKPGSDVMRTAAVMLLTVSMRLRLSQLVG